jgi:aspartate carbamoyltransferase regulatory subunit
VQILEKRKKKMEKEIKVEPIRNGTVIDRISAGRALDVFKILGIESPAKEEISTTMNARSKKMERKDIIMIENKELSPEETDKIALIAPQATINIIKDSEVVVKHRVELPKEIENIIKCANPNCISNAEKESVVSRFITLGEKPPKFRCVYCEKIIKDVVAYI